MVITGNAGNATKPKAKEFIFVVDPTASEITLDSSVVRAFRFIHEDRGNEDQENWNPTWRLFWNQGYPLMQTQERKSFKDGGWIPVFYIQDDENKVTSVGLAQMFKLAHSHSTLDLLENSAKEHLKEAAIDLPTAIFGAATDTNNEFGLKRRASFHVALSANGHKEVLLETKQNAILLSPKASFFPIYVSQPETDNAGELPKYINHRADKKSSPYATYTPLDKRSFSEKDANTKKDVLRPEHEKPELAGVKIWPARGRLADRVRPPYLAMEKTRKVSTTLNTLPKGTKFRTNLCFHNLRPAELGALLWGLTFGEKAAWSNSEAIKLRHRLGMGKPYGFGEIAIRVLSFDARSISGTQAHGDLDAFIRAFESEVGEAYKDATAQEWRDSIQIKNFLQAANPDEGNTSNTKVRRRSWNGQDWDVLQFDYMELNPEHGGWNDYQNAKNNGCFLSRYAEGTEAQREDFVSHAVLTPQHNRVQAARGGTAGRLRTPTGGPNASTKRARDDNTRSRRGTCYDELVEIIAEDGERIRVRFEDGKTEWVSRSDVQFHA